MVGLRDPETKLRVKKPTDFVASDESRFEPSTAIALAADHQLALHFGHLFGALGGVIHSGAVVSLGSVESL